MDLQADSWACGSSIRAISGPEKTLNKNPTQDEESVQPTHAQGLLSLWAAAVHVAAAQGDIEDIESELGPAISLRAERKPVPMLASIDEIEDGSQEVDSPHSQDTEKEIFSENRFGTGLLDQKNDDEKTILHDGNRTSIVPLAEIRRDSATGKDTDAGFLALLSAWSDDAPASKLLEKARLEPAKTSSKQNKRAEYSRIEKTGRTPSKVVLEKLRSKFPHTRASSPPPESKRWRTQDFDIYFGTDGAIKPRAEPWPTLEEDVAKEMQSTSRASPLLAELRMQLAADRVTRAPSDYSSFSKHLSDKGDPRQLPVAEVIAVQRARRAPEDLKAPVCVEKQRGWKMRSWGMAFWSYECGEAACECFRQYPPSTGSSDPGQIPVRARVDELGKYINILHDMDPQCAEDRYLAYPRYIASWSPFDSIPKGKSSERARQAVHASLRQALLGKDKAAVVNAFKNWLSLTKSEKAERDREQILADQKKHWEEETDRLRNQFDKEMRGTMTEHEKLKAQAQAQTELVLRRWLSMNELDISEHFVMWRRYTAATKDSSRKRNAVKDAMSRFLEGERRGVMHSTFTGWKTHVAQAAKDNSQIRKLEEQVERLLRKQEQSVQKYGTFLASKSGPAMKGLVFRRWFELSQGEKQRAELEREREVQLEEMARKHKMEETRKKEMRAKALHNLGVKGGRAVLLEVFLAWSYEYQKNKEVRCHKMNENQALVNYSKYILGKKLKEDSHALLASSFSEWRREGKILRHEDAMNTLEERDVYIAQLKAGFEEQLALAYQQIDQITETLQKELQTKEELAHELREAYEKNRKMNLPDYPVTPGSATPGSTRRRQTSTERRGTSVGSNVSRPARHSLPGSSLTKERETFFAGGLAQVSEPLAFQRPATTGHLQPPNGSASRSTSPRRDVNWDSVVDRLENRGVVSGRRLI